MPGGGLEGVQRAERRAVPHAGSVDEFCSSSS
jgi:hypothetical protein